MVESLAEARRRYADGGEDANERSTRMLTEIGLGIPKGRSHAITNEADARFWDALERDVQRIRARGGTVVYGIPLHEDDW